MNDLAVLIPTFNRSNFLKQALDSVDRQTSKDWRVIIYDDGSTDDTWKIVKQFSLKYPSTVYLQDPKNKGVAHARNELMDFASFTSDYFVWQDSDDISHPYRFEYMLNAIKEQKKDVVFSEMYFFLDPKEPSNKNIIHKIDVSKYINRDGLYNNTNFATGIFSIDLVDYKFNESLRSREDIDWLMKLIISGKTFGYLDKPLYWCRRHNDRLTYTK